MEVICTFVIERGDDEIELYICGDAEPYTPARFSGHPDNWSPPEGGAACVEGIFLDEERKERWEGKLTKKEEEDAEQLLMDEFVESWRNAAEDAAEAKAEAMRDDYDCDRYGDYGPDIHDF